MEQYIRGRKNFSTEDKEKSGGFLQFEHFAHFFPYFIYCFNRAHHDFEFSYQVVFVPANYVYAIDLNAI